jgi:hypothetical protein
MPAKTLELYLTFDGPFNVGAGALGGSLIADGASFYIQRPAASRSRATGSGLLS